MQTRRDLSITAADSKELFEDLLGSIEASSIGKELGFITSAEDHEERGRNVLYASAGKPTRPMTNNGTEQV